MFPTEIFMESEKRLKMHEFLLKLKKIDNIEFNQKIFQIFYTKFKILKSIEKILQCFKKN